MTRRALRARGGPRGLPPVKITTSQLRATVDRILDDVLENGTIVQVERRGRRVRIVAEAPRRKLDRLIERSDFIAGDPAALVHIDWSARWRP